MFHSFSSLRSNPFYVDSILDSKQVLDAAKKELKFTNGTADYSVFGKKYEKQYDHVRDHGVAQTSLRRKIWAIPNMAIGIYKTISHLAFALLLYILKAPSELNTKYKFCATRDLEEVYGNFVTIFNDKLGLYHIQQAQFQKKCYHEYSPRVIYRPSFNKGPLNQEFESKYSFNGSSSVGKFTSDRMINDAVKKITLSAYKSLPVEERETVIKLVSGFLSADFSKILERLPSKGLDLAQLLETASDDILEMFTLEDLQFFDLSPLKFVLKKDDEIAKLTLEELGIANIPNLNKGEICKIQYLSKRLKAIDLASDEMHEIVLGANTLGRVVHLSAEEISKELDELHPLAFAFFTNEQIAILDFNLLTNDQAATMFAALDNEDIAVRLSLFKEEDLIDAVNKNALCKKALQNLPASCLSEIRLSNLPKETIEGMFSCYAKDKKAESERFALLDLNEVLMALDKDLLSWNHLQLLSKDHLNEIELSRLSKETISSIFNCNAKDKEMEAERFGLLEMNEVLMALYKDLLSWNHFQLLSKDHLNAVELSKLSKETISSMFNCNAKDKDKEAERFAFLNEKEINEALKQHKLSGYHFNLLSLKQLQAINFAEMPQELINSLFPDYSIEAFRRSHTSFESSFRSANGKVLEDSSGYRCYLSESELRDMSNKQKQKNEVLFNKLLPQQQDYLTARLNKMI